MTQTLSTTTIVATGAASGYPAGRVLSWAWHGFAVPRGYPEMPEDVSAIVAGAAVGGIMAMWRHLVSRRMRHDADTV